MLSWFFKKPPLLGVKPAPPKPAPAPKPAAAPSKPVTKPVAKTAAEVAAEREAAEREWAGPLQAAQGDDDALLRVAQAAGSPLATKLAAVQALVAEAALRQAEKHFRSHDRKVHKLAKQRLEAAVAQREARAKAQLLIAATEALGAEAVVPVNHLVVLDRDWQALGVDQLEPAQKARFADLRAALDARVRAAGELQQQVQRWCAQAEQALAALRPALTAAAAEGTADDLAAHLVSMQDALTTCPEAPATAALSKALLAAQALADAVLQRLQLLQGLSAPVAATVPEAPAAAAADTAETTQVSEADATEAVPADPAPSEGGDAVDAAAEADTITVDAPAAEAAAADEPAAAADAVTAIAAVDAADAANAVSPETTTAAVTEAAPDATTPAAPEAPAQAALAGAAAPALKPATPSLAALWQALPALSDETLAQALQQRFDAHQQAVYAAAAAARVRAKPAPAPRPSPKAQRTPTAEQQQQLDGLLQAAEAAQADGQLTALQAALQAIDTALEGMPGLVPSARWRQGHQALLAERARLRGWQQWGGARARDDLADEAEALARATVAAADPEVPNPPKLRLKEHADAIQQLRTRWKELDRLGAVASQSLWQRFDAALHIAYEPVGVQQAALKAARQQNLADRQALLDTLEALPDAPAASGEGAATDTHGEEAQNFWREQMRALDRFQTAWRQLGPPEHTVPSAARNALMARHRAALDRVALPLQQARQVAAEQREQLIAQAEALVQAAARPGPNDAPQRVRDLQLQWQHHARQLPLARGVEAALWNRFRAATDAVFAQRDAVFHARDAELAANLVECQALIARVEALAEVDDNAEIKRTLAEADRLWRQGGELPRGAGPAMETRYHAARTAATQRLADSAQRGWQAQCDAAAAALALCQGRETGEPGDAADADSRWAAVGAMPAPWQAALQQRWKRSTSTGPLASEAVNTVLLQLESALDLPTPKPWQDARRNLKLLALKTAMEGGGTPATGPAQQLQWLASLLAQSGLDAAQEQRMQALLAAVRQGQPLVAPPRA
jgi:exonuclease SbcC